MAPSPAFNHLLDVRLGDGLYAALQEYSRRKGESASRGIREPLAVALDLEHHIIDQVSTSAPL